MSADPIYILVYKPILYHGHQVMYANLQLQDKDQTCKNIRPKDIEQVEKYKLQDGETFLYEHNDDMVEAPLTPMVEAVCLSADQPQKIIFNENTYAKIKYDDKGHLLALYESASSAAPLEMPVVIDNGACVNVTPKWFYDQNKILHSLPKQKSYLPQINTGNGLIDHHFWIDIPIQMQGVFLQVKSLVCATQAPYGLLLSRHALNQMQCIQVYDKQEVWLKQTAVPLIATTNTSIHPKQTKEVILKLDTTSHKVHIEGKSVSWIVTKQLGFPLQPVITNFVANTTTVKYINNTDKVQRLHKGETLGYLDLRSKDSSLTHLQWLVPLNKSKGQYTLYGHTTFVNALAQQSLADETDNQQQTNQLEIRQRPLRLKKRRA